MKRAFLALLLPLVLTSCAQQPAETVTGQIKTSYLNLANTQGATSKQDMVDVLSRDLATISECVAVTGSDYDYLGEDKPVYLYDQDGNLIGEGVFYEGSRVTRNPDSTNLDCLFPFLVKDVKLDVEFVTLKTGSFESGPLSKKDLEKHLMLSVD